MTPKKRHGSITISRWTGNKPPYSGITIALTDETSGTRCVEIALTSEALGNALTGSMQECEFEWHPQNVGKVREHKTMTITFKAKDYKNRESEARAALVPFEVDGWSGDWRDLCNMHRSAGNDSFHVSFTRFVDAP